MSSEERKKNLAILDAEIKSLVITRLSSAQKNTLHYLDQCLFAHDSGLNKIERLSYQALERKGLVRMAADCNGENTWELI